MLLKTKKGQVTLFIIFSLIIFLGLIIYFIFSTKIEKKEEKYVRENLREEFINCFSPLMKKILKNYSEEGLFLNKEDYIEFEEKKVPYFCFSKEKERICERKGSHSIERIKEEIKEKSKEPINFCFDQIKEEKEKKGFFVEMKENSLDIEVLPTSIFFNLKKEVLLKKEKEEKFVKDFSFYLDFPLFDFLKISNEIINEEVSCRCPEESCYANIIRIMKENEGYEISYFIKRVGEKVYTIKDNKENKLNFAIKNCY
ncbi:MAG: hypothetical protein QW273_00500 [Candidatus Pacearchaeota archaeon]